MTGRASLGNTPVLGHSAFVAAHALHLQDDVLALRIREGGAGAWLPR